MSEPAARVAPWEDFVLRVIAIWKLSHAVFFIAVGFGLLKLRHHNVLEILNDYVVVPYRLDPENRWVDWTLEKAAVLAPHMTFLGWTAFFYATLFAVEGMGLYLRKHWAEYMVVIVTGSLLPLELWELYIKLAWWKLGIVSGNLLIVGYLIHRIVLDAKAKALRRAQQEEAETAAATLTARPKPVANEVP